MPDRDFRDIIGGTLLGALGIGATIYAIAYLPIGSISRMGPGLFPASVGVILAMFGVAIVASAFRRAGAEPWAPIDARSFIVISISILIFAGAIGTIGLLPAVFIMTLFATRADGKLTALQTALLSTGLAAFSGCLFVWLLGLPIDLYRLPW